MGVTQLINGVLHLNIAIEQANQLTVSRVVTSESATTVGGRAKITLEDERDAAALYQLERIFGCTA